jgi:hypothetical protein
MKCVRARIALEDGDIEVAKTAIKLVRKLARTEAHADEVLNAARLLEREIRGKTQKRSRSAKARKARS